MVRTWEGKLPEFIWWGRPAGTLTVSLWLCPSEGDAARKASSLGTLLPPGEGGKLDTASHPSKPHFPDPLGGNIAMLSQTWKGKENPLEKSPCPFLASGEDRERNGSLFIHNVLRMRERYFSLFVEKASYDVADIHPSCDRAIKSQVRGTCCRLEHPHRISIPSCALHFSVWRWIPNGSSTRVRQPCIARPRFTLRTKLI